MKKLSLLLTGGSGMVGKNILDHRLANEYEIYAPSSKELNLTNAQAVADYFLSNKIDLVVHTAGKVGGIQANLDDPVKFLEHNLNIGRNLIMSAYKAGVRNLINLASTCMYPKDINGALTENLLLTGELEPTNEGYALSKIVSTKLCQYISQENPEMYYKTLIPCNLYGRYDRFCPREAHLLPAIIRKVHKAKITGKQNVEIWGDGSARREFMYAGDLADAVFNAARDIKKIPNLMNCGLGYDYSIYEYYKTVANVIGWNGGFSFDQSKPTGMKRKLSSIELQSKWGWSATTNLKSGIQKTYNYYLEEVVK